MSSCCAECCRAENSEPEANGGGHSAPVIGPATGIRARSARVRRLQVRHLRRGSGQTGPTSSIRAAAASAQVAQLVEQRTENPCVGSSILPLGTILLNGLVGQFLQ